MRNTKILSSLAVFLFLLMSSAFAQQRLQLTDTIYAEGALRYFKLGSDAPRKSIQDAKNILSQALATNENTSFREVRIKNRSSSEKSILYQQLYKGIPVYDGYFFLHFKNDLFDRANGEYSPVEKIANKIVLNRITAMGKAIAGAASGKWAQPLEKKINLILWRQNREAVYRYVYEVEVIYANATKSRIVMVDAATGEILQSVPTICSVNVPCTGTTIYSGLQSFTGDTFGGGVRLREVRNTVNITTLNNQNNVNHAGIDFANATANWTSAGANAGALDVHFATERFLDYFGGTFSRNSIDNNGRAIINYTNVWDFDPITNTTFPMDNAFFEPNSVTFNFGQGFLDFFSVTSLDVVAHEMGHGMAWFEVGFNNTGEARSLNEGFSDIWGATVENQANLPGKQTWTMGEEIMANGFSCLRSLRNPAGEGFNVLTFTEGGYPDTRLGPNWSVNANDPPHINATVLGHWYFLLSQGGFGTNGIGNAFSVGGLGINTAAQIAYNTELALTPAADYASVRVESIAYATSQWGANSCQVKAVTDAWFAVGVGAPYNGTLGLSIAGQDLFCSSSSSYSITGLPGSASVVWSALPWGAVTINTPTSVSTTLTKNYDAVTTLQASVSNVCTGGGSLVTLNKNVVVGFPPYGGPSGPDIVWPSGNYYYWLDPIPGFPGITAYNWTVPAGWTILSGQGTNILYVQTGTTGGDVAVEVTACDVLRPTAKYVEVGSGPWWPDRSANIIVRPSVRLYPNPANNLLTIAMYNKTVGGKENYSFFTSVVIYDVTGTARKRISYGKGTLQAQINVSDLGTGVYTVEVSNGKGVERQQLLIRK